MLQSTALFCLRFIQLHNDEDLGTTIVIYAEKQTAFFKTPTSLILIWRNL